MDRVLYTAMGGAVQTMRSQTANSHNLANASTVGFRGEVFSTFVSPISGDGFGTRVQAGLTKPGWDNSDGPIMHTGRDLDIALREDSWLAVQAPDGSEAYTRAGDLKVDEVGRLLTGAGYPVMNEQGPIALPPSSQVSIAPDGSISVIPQGQGPETQAVVTRLKVVTAGPDNLTRGDDGLMRAKEGVQLEAAPGNTVMSGALEGSNVNIATAMVQMIELARQFELQTKVMKTAEEHARAATTLVTMS